jgi:uncharacterized membrane protein YdjX (TVP38/TMEM64 family)
VRDPSSKDLSLMRGVIEFYMRDNYSSVLITLCAIYIFLQAFAVPGPAILAVLMAALFGGLNGAIMSMACSLIGSSICYTLFGIVGKPILDRYFSSGVAKMRLKIRQNGDNMFFYFLFLRVTPLLPNWFINISSGNLGISFLTFFFGTMIGLIPNAIILARAGVELATLGDASKAPGGFDLQRALGLLGIGALALLPILLKNRFKDKALYLISLSTYGRKPNVSRLIEN